MAPARKIVAIVGTYRKGKVTDSAASEVLRGAESRGAETEKIYLIDKQIEFCNNCRMCTQKPDVGRRGACIFDDDMQEILTAVDAADGLVLAAPTNFYNVTAVTRRFMERLIVYTYWPWQAKMGPEMRIKPPDKKAVTITSTACPAFLGRILIRGPRQALKIAAGTMGASVQASLYYGTVAKTPDATLSRAELEKAYETGVRLADSFN
jgi:putative NADPH-quinone reductase